MARVGETIVNPATGEEITWLRVDDEVLEWEDLWPPGHQVPPHVHPGMEERWRVIEGEPAFRIGDDPERRDVPGDEIVAPAGVTHSGRNPTNDRVRLRVSMTPPLRWAEVAEKLFAGRSPLALLRDYPAELAPPPS
jgi:mannose-6-phosphate isomerase-like protein (cupin superfamily)